MAKAMVLWDILGGYTISLHSFYMIYTHNHIGVNMPSIRIQGIPINQAGLNVDVRLLPSFVDALKLRERRPLGFMSGMKFPTQLCGDYFINHY